MTRTKKKKIILWLSLAAGALVVVAALLFFLWPRSQPPSAGWLDITSYESSPGTTLLLQNPEAKEAPTPLPRCTIAAPEGWEQLKDSARTANRYSQSYTDLFYRDGWLMEFAQRYAADLTKVNFSTRDYETVQFRGWEVLVYATETKSGAMWVADNYLLELTYFGDMERDQLLEWVAAVETEDPQLPQTRPLEFVPGYHVSVADPAGYWLGFSNWALGGNPEPGEWEEQYVFVQPPEGFTLSDRSETQYTCLWEYQTPAGNRLTLENGQLSPYSNNLFPITISSDFNDFVQQVTVQGREGLLYWEESSDISILVWLEEDYFVRLTYEGSTTPEQMLAWGESTVVQPV